MVVRVHNTLSADIEFGEILGFSEPAISPSEYTNETGAIPSVKGISPLTPLHSNQFVVALNGIRGTDALAGGAIGPAVLMGLAWVKVNWTDESHTHVKVEEGETKLQSSTSGIKPIYYGEIPEELPADVWALINLGGGGGSSAKVAAAIWIVTTEISEASDTLPTITPGTGFAVQGEVDPDTGELSPMDMTPVEIYNYDPGETYEVDTGIYVADVPGTDLTMVLSGHCNKYTAAPEDP